MAFNEISVSQLNDNFFEKIGKEWMLITAGDSSSLNTMTASWGGTGIIWNKNVTFAFIRDSRYTKEFVDNNEFFSISFFNGGMKPELTFCGRNSGRDTDKLSQTGLIPLFDENAPYFEQAGLVFICRKLFSQQISKEGFIDKELISKFYSDNDLHELYIGEIVKVLKKI